MRSMTTSANPTNVRRIENADGSYVEVLIPWNRTRGVAVIAGTAEGQQATVWISRDDWNNLIDKDDQR